MTIGHFKCFSHFELVRTSMVSALSFCVVPTSRTNLPLVYYYLWVFSFVYTFRTAFYNVDEPLFFHNAHKSKYYIANIWRNKAATMDNRVHRNGVNMANIVSRRKYVCVFMSMYLCMYRVERWRDAFCTLGICYTMFITCQRSMVHR